MLCCFSVRSSGVSGLGFIYCAIELLPQVSFHFIDPSAGNWFCSAGSLGFGLGIISCCVLLYPKL